MFFVKVGLTCVSVQFPSVSNSPPLFPPKWCWTKCWAHRSLTSVWCHSGYIPLLYKPPLSLMLLAISGSKLFFCSQTQANTVHRCVMYYVLVLTPTSTSCPRIDTGHVAVVLLLNLTAISPDGVQIWSNPGGPSPGSASVHWASLIANSISQVRAPITHVGGRMGESWAVSSEAVNWHERALGLTLLEPGKSGKEQGPPGLPDIEALGRLQVHQHFSGPSTPAQSVRSLPTKGRKAIFMARSSWLPP